MEPDDLDEQGRHYRERVIDASGLFPLAAVFQQILRFPNLRLSALPSPTVEATCHLRVESVERFSGNVAKLREELAGAASGDRILIACHNEAELHRLGEILHGRGEDRGSKIEDGSAETPFSRNPGGVRGKIGPATSDLAEDCAAGTESPADPNVDPRMPPRPPAGLR